MLRDVFASRSNGAQVAVESQESQLKTILQFFL